MKKSIKKSLNVISLVLFTLGLFSFTSSYEIISTVPETPGGAYLTFAEKFGGDVTIKDLKGANEIGVAGCAKGSRIFQFNLKITKNGKKISYKGTSPVLTKEMLTTLRSLSNGDEFIFEKAKAYLPDGKSEVDVWGKKFRVV